MNLELLRPFTTEEVKQALDSMHPLKSPGPDGMSPVFFQHSWSVVDSDVYSCVLQILNEHVLMHNLNHTYIVLLPKCKFPEYVSDFRPISLCIVIYKLASKAIANQVKPFLNTLISHSQSAFSPGRSILDNVLVAYKVNHYLSHKHEEAFSSMVRKEEAVGAIRGGSGLQVNYQKSAVVFSKNIPLQTQVELATVLGVNRITKHEKYLACLLLSAALYEKYLQVSKRRCGNDCKAGRLSVYLKQDEESSFNQLSWPIPAYVMSCFIIPEAVLNKIESIHGCKFLLGSR
ncbi:UNVERIFIED_CONTAM: hypothetical protein Slati_3542300 [Sesamum latifolium]|uniref:Reverse transcriptase domain-containing protein n=1 Tax=Sesamum latifolium TaxID=2727402 RepID=A0AAW2UJG3_9LAMI